MSLKKSATRLSLLAGSSIAAAGLAMAVLTPSAAFAANECTPTGATGATPGTNGATADTYECTLATYATGVTYDAVGNLTVTKTNTGVTTITADGVNLTADGTETLTWTSSVGGVTGGTTTNGPVISATSTGSGLITVNAAAVTGSNATITYGVYAQSTGGGNIAINAVGGTISATHATNGIAGVFASSNGGDITINQDFRTSSATVTGRLYGIQASTTGAGNISLLANKGASAGTNMTTTSSSGIAAIDASVQTGDLLIQTVGGVNNTSATGIGVRAKSRGGDIQLDIIQGTLQAGASTASPGSAIVEVDMLGGLATINNVLGGRLGSSSSGKRADPFLRALGDGDVVFNNGGEVYGSFQLGGFIGDVTFNNTAPLRGWATRGTNVFSQGADTLNNLAGGVITAGAIPNATGMSLQSALFSFGTGVDTINNAGMLVIGENHSTNWNAYSGQTLEITGLERFNNAGLIVMGSFTPQQAVGGILGGQTDLYYDDVFVMRNGHFHGEDGSRIWVDVNFNNVGQTGCARNVSGLAENVSIDTEDGRLRANDCLDFRGSAVSGRTGFILADTIAGDRGAYNPEGNVIVDVKGSNPADVDPEAFFVAPESFGYDATGRFVDKGLFAYTIGYDDDDETFRIYGVASPTSAQLPLLGQAANDLWRTSTAPWLERRAAQREAAQEGVLTTRFWIRGAIAVGEREVEDIVPTGVLPLVYDNSYTQNDAAVAIGLDLVSGAAFGGEWIAGAMAGYAQAKLSYDASVNTSTLEGGGVGLYGSFTAGPFFQDVVVNANFSNLLATVPSLNLQPAGTLLESDILTLGVRMETGWRFEMGPVRIEPLASLIWSQASFDDMDVPAADPVRFGGNVEFDNASSVRAGLGLRLGASDIAPSLMPIDVSLTARSMQEFDGRGAVNIVNLGPSAALAKTFDGTYSEISGGVTLGGDGGHVSGFINVGGTWGEAYEARTAQLGLRLRW